MAQICFRIDDETKHRAEEVFDRMGLTMSGAITIFIRQTLNRNEIPFPVTANISDRERIEQAFRDWKNGRKNYHFHELIEVDAPKPAIRRRQSPRKAVKSSRRAITSESSFRPSELKG